MSQPLYQQIARALDAMRRCDQEPGHPWSAKWRDRLRLLEKELPSGSGLDLGTRLDLDASTGDKLVFETSYHHMNEGGMYDGWTSHSVTARPSFIHGLALTVGGRNRHGIKDYLAEVFDAALRADAEVRAADEEA